MQQADSTVNVDLKALKAQVDADIASRLAAEAESAQHIHRRGFRVGNLALLVEMDAASAVAELPAVYRLPGAPLGVKGLINHHGRVVPVVDLFGLLGFAVKPSAHQWLLVCGWGEAAVGLLIDSLPERKVFGQGDVVDTTDLANPLARFARAAYREGGLIWLDMDMENFFAAVFGYAIVVP